MDSPSSAPSPTPAPPPAEKDLIRLARRQVEEVRSRTRTRNIGPDSARLGASNSTTVAGGAAGLGPFAVPGYEMGDEIHRGGQGVVYRAVHLGTGRAVAVKVQHATGVLGDVERARFEREVRILAHLRHPNIVTVYDVGHNAGWTYHVMDFVDGQPLDAYVASKALDARDTMRLMERVAWAVSAAHLRGVIHRDLKPGNILVDKSDEPRVLDFGLAKGPEFGDTVTMTGQFVGSLPWASPEQVSGDPALVDVRSDVYSLGVILYRLLTDGFPYDVSGSVHQVMSNIQHTDPAPPELGEEIDTIVLKCLRKEPGRRYQSAGDLASDIGRFLRGEPIDAKRESRWYVVRKQMRRHRKTTVFASVLLATLIGSSVVAWVLYARAERTAARLLIADRVARERLCDSLISEARALRSGMAPGRRWRSLGLLSEAVVRAGGPDRLRPHDRTRMRDEALAAMSLCDATEEFVPPRSRAMLSQCFAPDGSFRVIGLEDGRVQLWGVPDTEPKGEFPLPTGVSGMALADSGVYFVCVTSTGRYVAARYGIGANRRMVIWDLVARTPLIVLPPLQLPNGCDFGPVDAWVAIAADSQVQIFSLPGGKLQREIPMEAEARMLACDLWNGRLAVHLGNGQIKIIDVGTGAILKSFESDEWFHTFAFSSDGSLMAGMCDSSRIIVWETKNWTVQRTLTGHQGAVVDGEFGPDGKSLVSWSWDGTTRLWDTITGELLLAPLNGYCAIRYGSDGPIVSMTNGVSLWRFDRATEYRRFNTGEPHTSTSWFAVSPGAKRVAVEERDSYHAVVYDVESGRMMDPLPRVAWVHWFPKGGLVGVNEQGVVRWDLELPPETDAGRVVYRSKGVVKFIALPDQRRGVVQDAKGRIVLIDLETGAEIHVLHENLGSTCSALKASPDGRWISADAWRGSVLHVWNAQTGEVAAQITQEPIGHTRGWFSADGRWLVVSRGPAFDWYDTSDWQPKRHIDRDDAMERIGGLVAYSPDGSMIALAITRRRMQILDAQTLEPIAFLATPDASFQVNMEFSDDGRWLFAADVHGVVHVWDLRLIRANLAEMGLDWTASAPGGATLPSGPPPTAQ